MKICIDATPIGIRTTDRGGVYRYVLELVRSLHGLDRENTYTLFFNFFRRDNLPFYRKIVKTLDLRDNFRCRVSRLPNRLRDSIDVPFDLIAGRHDIFHSCFDHLPPVMRGSGVVTIHDVRYLEDSSSLLGKFMVKSLERHAGTGGQANFKDYIQMIRLQDRLRRRVRKTANRARVIITVSEYSKRRIVELLGVPADKVKVIHHGVNKVLSSDGGPEAKRVLVRRGITKPYFLYVGKYDPLKNLGTIIEALKNMTRKFDFQMVFVGPKNWYYRVIADKAASMGLENSCVFTDFVPDHELRVLYEQAKAFLYPTLYEGFGLPVLEAMAAGIPVVTTRVCSIPEVVGNAGLFVDPYSPEDIASALNKIVENPDLASIMVQRGLARTGAFQWERVARSTLQIYEDVANIGRSGS